MGSGTTQTSETRDDCDGRVQMSGWDQEGPDVRDSEEDGVQRDSDIREARQWEEKRLPTRWARGDARGDGFRAAQI